MPYIEGFVAAVPTANREAYIENAKQGAEYFKKLGATRVTECWGNDVPRGEVTDFFRATQAKDDETVIFSWIEYPDKASRDAANEKMGADAEMMNMEMPFDGQRMFWVASSRCWTNSLGDVVGCRRPGLGRPHDVLLRRVDRPAERRHPIRHRVRLSRRQADSISS